jgi:thiaminase (transcriptional activator TenA)
MFRDKLWSEIRTIYGAIGKHPFLTGLTAGTLPRDRFAFYVTQDALYLREFARALASLAAIAPNEAAITLFGRHAVEALKVEAALHEGFVRDLGMHIEQVRAAEPAPTCLAYTSFLLATTRGGPFHEGLAAILPCYWIYQRVGRGLLPKGSPDPLYARWIAAYGGDEFDRLVAEVLALTDTVATGLTEAQRSAMIRRFVTASRYEWMFWEMAYQRERWPV